jgi:hypothetical protein
MTYGNPATAVDQYLADIDEQDIAYEEEIRRDIDDESRALDEERRREELDAERGIVDAKPHVYHHTNGNGELHPTRSQTRRARKLRRLNKKKRGRFSKSRRHARNGHSDD